MHINAHRNGRSHTEQNMTMVIIGFNHDDLVEKQGTRDKAAVTLQCKEVLGKNGYDEEVYFYGDSKSSVATYDVYTNSEVRTNLNSNFINALPETIIPLIKTVNKKCITNCYGSSSSLIQDKVFWVSYTEVYGNVVNRAYKQGKKLENDEGMQYEYFKTSSNRKKTANNNGIPGTMADWWTRSPSSDSPGYGYALKIDSYSDISIELSAEKTSTEAPAFCL